MCIEFNSVRVALRHNLNTYNLINVLYFLIFIFKFISTQICNIFVTNNIVTNKNVTLLQR